MFIIGLTGIAEQPAQKRQAKCRLPTTSQIYARITNDKIGQDMAALSEKLNSVFKVTQ